MNAQNGGFFGSKGCKKNGVRIGLHGWVVGHVHLLQAGVVHELVEVPQGDAAIVWSRGQNVIVPAEYQSGQHPRVMGEIPELKLRN